VLAGPRVFLTTDGGASFEPVGGGLPPARPGGLAFDPIDPLTVYATARRDGLFQSVDGARSFTRLPGLSEDQLRGSGVNSVSTRPGDGKGPQVIYAGTSLGPVRSDDGGSTFAPIHDGFRGTSVNDITIDAAGRVLIATTVFVFRSTAQDDYEIISDSLPREIAGSFQAVAVASDDPQLYAVGGGRYRGPGGIFRTTNGGSTWTHAVIPGNPSFWSRTRIAFAPSDSRRIYVVSSSLGASGLFRSDDDALSFDQLSMEVLRSIAVDPRDPDVLYAGSGLNRGLFKSTDGGRTLTQVVPNGSINAIAIDPQSPQVIYAGLRFGSVLRSVDGGQTFNPAAQGLTGDQVLGLGIVPAQPMRLFAWMHAGGLFRSNNGADSWKAVDVEVALRRSTAEFGQHGLAIDTRDPERVYMGHASVLQFVNQ